MAERPINKKAQPDEASYPSLREHILSRRRFLTLCGASAALGGVWAACGSRGLGNIPDDGGTDPDAGRDAQVVEPDSEVEIGGVVEQPDYFTVRIPLTGETTAYLLYNGYCVFYVEAITYQDFTRDYLQESLSAAEDTCREVLEDFTYDQLSNPAGVLQAEDDLHAALEGLCQDNESADCRLEGVTLSITYLTDDSGIDGGAPYPDYP